MGRIPSHSNEMQKREAWTAQEDKILAAYIKAHGEGKWKNIPKRTGKLASTFVGDAIHELIKICVIVLYIT